MGSLPGEGVTVAEEVGQSRNPSACDCPCVAYGPCWVVMGMPRERAAEAQLHEEMVGEQVGDRLRAEL